MVICYSNHRKLILRVRIDNNDSHNNEHLGRPSMVLEALYMCKLS